MREILSVCAAALLLCACSGPRLLNTFAANPDRSTDVVHDLSYADHPRATLDIYRPATAGPHPVLVYIHGGGWYRGNKDEYAFVGKRFAAEGYLTAMVNYRLTPDGAWPHFMEDVAAAVAYVHDNAASYGGDPDRFFTAGHSAGAYNAVMIAVAPEFLAAHGKGTDIIDGTVGLSGPYDFTLDDGESIIAAFGGAADFAATQPVARVTAGAPPMLLIQGEKDKSVETRNATAMAAALEEAGVRVELVLYPEANHADTVIALAWPRHLPVVEEMTAFFASVPTE